MAEELMREPRRRTYEFAYLLSPSLSEEDVRAWAQEILEWLGKNESEMKERQEARRQMLSYPIQHQKQGYFGFMRFIANAALPASLRDKIKYDQKLLRHLILENPAPAWQAIPQRRMRPQAPTTPEAVAQIDKQVDEAIAAAEAATSSIPAD